MSSKFRTEASEKAFADECVKIEKKGGNVLEHIRVNYPSYTPRAVWIRLQRDVLKRQVSKITSGRPKDEPKPEPVYQSEWREVKEEMPIKKIMSLDQLFGEVLKAIDEGRNLKQLLKDLGYKNESSAIANVKAWAKKHKPDRWEVVCNTSLNGTPIKAQEAAKATPDAQMENDKAEPEKAPESENKADSDESEKSGGKIESGKMYIEGDDQPEMVLPERKKASPTCCQPARESGVTVPDELPEKKYPIGDGTIRFRTKQITSNLGVWENGMDGKLLAFAALGASDGRNILCMPIADWLNLAAEIPEAIKALAK